MPAQARSFSPQELVSCVPNPNSCGGQGGCNGATVELALDWVMQHGLADEQQVPYSAGDLPCRVGANSNVPGQLQTGDQVMVATKDVGGLKFGMTGWTKLPENSYEPLLRAVSTQGPAAVSVGARGWHTYASGIFDFCDKDVVINHAVTLLGYGADPTNGDKYWLILNSWGSGWGEGGTMRLLRKDSDETEYCGVDKQPEMGTGCTGGPAEVKVCGMCGILYDAVLPVFVGNVAATK